MELTSEQSFYLKANDLEINDLYGNTQGLSIHHIKHKLNYQPNPPKHFKSNDPINLISIKVALIDKETLSNKASEDYTKYTLPRLKDIKTLKDSVPERYGEFDTAKCLNDRSINEFISHTFLPIDPTINNIDGLLGILTEEDFALGGAGVSAPALEIPA